jgi:hypothetical protein
MKYKPGDKVTCDLSEEIEQPMEIVGRNLWYTDPGIIIYYVKGKHKKRGNELTITLSEGVLKDAN